MAQPNLQTIDGDFVLLPQLLADYRPFDEHEAANLVQLRQFLDDSTNPYDRGNLVAHTVADAWVVSPDRTHVLMVLHRVMEVWIAPGGHTDGSPDMLAAARRELFEEAGLPPEATRPLLAGRLFDVNAGCVPFQMKAHGLEPPHLHFDICFAFEAAMDFPLICSEESHDVVWIPVAEALEKAWPGHRRRCLKTLSGLLG